MIGAKKSEFKDDNGFLSTEHTFYIDGIEEIIPAATSQYSLINKAPISEGVMFIQTVTRANSGVESGFEYLHKDYLGSTEVVTDDNGYRLISFAYDAFGSRRHADWSKALTDSELKTLAKTLNIKNRRGFTGREHLDRTGIIHMNGRIYDPVLARFLSPDPLVSNPYFSQSYNRYNYVLNNPLGMTDPSGYSPSCTSDDGCTEARTERLAGPGNYIAHSRHYKEQKGTKSGASGKDKKDKAGELNKPSGGSENISTAAGRLTGSTNVVGKIAKGAAELGRVAKASPAGIVVTILANSITKTGNGELTDADLQRFEIIQNALKGIISGAIAAAKSQGKNYITLFRTAGPREARDIRSTGVFRLGLNLFPKQFTIAHADAVSFQSSLSVLGNQFSNPDFTLPHTIFAANVTFGTVRHLIPGRVADNGGTNILTAQTTRVLGMVNTDARRLGGIQKLGTR